MDNMQEQEYNRLRQMGMAPSRQIDMAPLNIPGVARTVAPAQGGGGVSGIDQKIQQLESMFANVRTDRAFTPQEIQDMTQRRQVLENLYRIRETSQSRELADEERKQKIEALRQAGEDAKQKRAEAQRQKQTQLPGTYALEQMGQNPFRSGGYMVDSSGRKVDVPMYGTVTPSMYGKLGQATLTGAPAPTAEDFQPTTADNKYLQTQQRIQEATNLGDYGKASALAQQQISNLVQIAAMPNLAPEAKAAIVTQIENLANQSKQNAVMAQQQIKSNADIEKVKANADYKKGEQERKLFEVSAKLSQGTKKALSKAYFDAMSQVYEVPFINPETQKPSIDPMTGKPAMIKKTLNQLTPQEKQQYIGAWARNLEGGQIANTLAMRSLGMEPPAQISQPKPQVVQPPQTQGQPQVQAPAPAQTAPPAQTVTPQTKPAGRKKTITVDNSKLNDNTITILSKLKTSTWIDNPQAGLSYIKQNPNYFPSMGVDNSTVIAVLNAPSSQERLDAINAMENKRQGAIKKGEKARVAKSKGKGQMDTQALINQAMGNVAQMNPQWQAQNNTSSTPSISPTDNILGSVTPSIIQSNNKAGIAIPDVSSINPIREAQNIRSGLPSNYVPSTPSDLRVRPANTVDAQNAIFSAGSFNPLPLVMSNIENGIQLQSPNSIISPEVQRDFLIQLLAGIKESFGNKRRNVKPTY